MTLPPKKKNTSTPYVSYIGVLTENELKIHSPSERVLSLHEIAFAELKENRIFILNYFFGFVGIVCFFYGLLFDYFYFLFPGILFISISLFYKKSRFYVLIILRIPEKIFIKINSKDIPEIKIFLKKVNEFVNTTEM